MGTRDEKPPSLPTLPITPRLAPRDTHQESVNPQRTEPKTGVATAAQTMQRQEHGLERTAVRGRVAALVEVQVRHGHPCVTKRTVAGFGFVLGDRPTVSALGAPAALSCARPLIHSCRVPHQPSGISERLPNTWTDIFFQTVSDISATDAKHYIVGVVEMIICAMYVPRPPIKTCFVHSSREQWIIKKNENTKQRILSLGWTADRHTPIGPDDHSQHLCQQQMLMCLDNGIQATFFFLSHAAAQCERSAVCARFVCLHSRGVRSACSRSHHLWPATMAFISILVCHFSLFQTPHTHTTCGTRPCHLTSLLVCHFPFFLFVHSFNTPSKGTRSCCRSANGTPPGYSRESVKSVSFTPTGCP